MLVQSVAATRPIQVESKALDETLKVSKRDVLQVSRKTASEQRSRLQSNYARRSAATG
jgi:hypothetical protein